MDELWSSASYEPRLLSLPFALAPAAMLIVIAYAAVMRGAPVLRGFLLAHCLALLPYGIVMMLSPSITSPVVAKQLFGVAAGFIPMAAATGTGFQLALIGKYRRYRWVVWFLVANAAIWIPLSATTDYAIDGVQWLDAFWYPVAGAWAPQALLHTLLLSIGGFAALGHAALVAKPSDERRQLRAALLANTITYAGLIDVGLAYGIGVFPLGWLLSGVGSLLVVRALVVEDLLKVRAVDTTAPLLVVHFAGGVLLAWITLAQLGDVEWPIQLVAIAVAFAGVRMAVTTIAMINRGARGGEGPLERLLGQLVGRARTLTSSPQVGQLAIDIVELGIGVRAKILLASEQDWGWTAADGTPLAEEDAPDPLVVGWLAEQREIRTIFADDLEPVPADLRDAVQSLVERHAVRALVLVRSGDELIAILAMPAPARMRGRQLEFLERVAERLAEALLHARMARHAGERAVLAREVELAATVQVELLPGKGPHVHGDVTVVGSWRPATRCAGDFWGVYPLVNGRVLVVIGDVTGHGVASAMVTAAAAGAFDVYVRRESQHLELDALMHALDIAVRRVGGGELVMTAFAAIFDPDARQLRFVSCGHTAPYLCRPLDTGIELHALVGRGNPLGAGVPAQPKVLERELHPGDLVVCYTDGVIEAMDHSGRPYGNRRFQQLLKKLDRGKLAALAVHDLLQAGVAAHRAGRPLDDDETIVIAHVVPPPAGSLEPARAEASP